MRFRMIGVTVAAVARVLTACAEEISTPASDDAERSALVQRTLDLKASVEAAGRITPDDRRALDDLRARILAWQARTGRSDLAVSAAKPPTESVIHTASHAAPRSAHGRTSHAHVRSSSSHGASMKAIVTLLSATLALAGCSSVTGPDEHAAEMKVAAAKRSLEAASKAPTPSLKLAAN